MAMTFHPCCSATADRTRDGSALIVALWVIGLLSLMIASFAFDAHLQTRVTSHYRKRMKAEQLARSGIERARMLLAESAGLKGSDSAENENEAWYPDARRLADGLNVVNSSDSLGDGRLSLTIIPEPARRNVNRLTEEDWVRVFEVGGVPEELWDRLIDAVMDWIDPDDDARAYGAESDDHYLALDPPYRAKNAPLDTVDELLLIKGFSRAILYGGPAEGADDKDPLMSGIADLLTTFGDGKVNVNAAPRRVLMTLPFVDDLTADDIILEREGDPDLPPGIDTSYQDPADFGSRFPGLDNALRNLITTDSQILRITSIADVQGVRWTVSCVASYSQDRLSILRWQEQAGP